MLTIAWDVDDVLNDLMRVWFEEYWIPSQNKPVLSYEDISQNPPHKVLGISRNEYLSSLDKYRLSDSALGMKPNAEILSWLQVHGSKYKHLALTATPLKAAHMSAFWVTKHFGQWIRSFNFVPSPREDDNFPAYHQDKAEFLNWIKTVDVFIDDNEENIAAAEALGIRGILISRPWNSGGYSIKQALGMLDGMLINKL